MNAKRWRALKRSAGYKVVETLNQHFEIVNGSESGATVSPIVWSEENARLMSAAPELLESLRYMVANAEAEGWSELMVGDARAAIAKAEGRGEA